MTSDSKVAAEPTPSFDDDLHTFFTRLARISLFLEDFQHRCFDAYNIRFVDYSVLRVLHLSPPPYQLSPTRLSELVVRSTGGMTQIVDRLERAGLVRRLPDPSDRRKVIVQLTAEGFQLVERANRSWVEQKNELLGRVSDQDFARMDEQVRNVLSLFSDDFDRQRQATADPAPDLGLPAE